ncbi:MAG: GNAT family N-acetyltransferase [Dermatophilaceae bacterium]
MAVELEFIADPARFLEVCAGFLARSPVLNTVVASVAHQAASGDDPAEPQDWWLVIREHGDVAGVGMRTAHFGPRPAYLLPMPDQAARALARALHERGEPLGGINGALPAVRLCAEEAARLRGERVMVSAHTRLFQLGELTVPATVPGTLRTASAEHLELALAWFEAFSADADEQAGRPRGVSAHPVPDREGMLRAIAAGRIWLWTDATGAPVHVTSVSRPSFGAVRLGPVYTPPSERGRGYASAAVAAVTRHLLTAGATPCLFTDQANPTSNAIYQRLGYLPLVDMANLLIGPTKA